MKQDLREALPKVRNPPSFTLRKEKNKGGFVKPAPGADFTKGLSFWLSQGLKSKTLVLARSGT